MAISAFKMHNGTKFAFVFVRQFTSCRYSWHWSQHNYKIYILHFVVLRSDAHTRDTPARRQLLSYTHIEEMVLVLGLAGTQSKIMMYRKTADKTNLLFRNTQDHKKFLRWYPSGLCSLQTARTSIIK